MALLLMAVGAAGQVQFDGVNDRINTMAGSSLLDATFGSSAVSITGWVRVDRYVSSVSGVLLYVPDASAYVCQFLDASRDGTNAVRVGGRSEYPSDTVQACLLTNAYGLGEIFMITGIIDYANKSILIYKNGILAASNSVSFTYNYQAEPDSDHPSTLGSRFDGAYPFSGSATDIRVYSRALSASEIRSIYETPWALTDDPDLVLRTCIVTNDTGTALTGVAKNYGTGADGTYSNSPTAAPWTIIMT
jgi:hypothetical protein